ncbi:MAG: hypothetical protein WKF93_04720 [Acidimicrobiales bacterium]
MERTIEATIDLHATPDRATAVLIDDPATVLADGPTAGDRRAHYVRTVLSLDVGSGASLEQEVEVEFDAPRRSVDDDGVVMALRWHATGHERLLPTFSGALSVTPATKGSHLALSGHYRVPLGAAGRFGDGLAGRRIARQTLETFVAEMGGRLDAAVVRRIDATPHHPAPYPVSLLEDALCPEIHFG